MFRSNVVKEDIRAHVESFIGSKNIPGAKYWPGKGDDCELWFGPIPADATKLARGATSDLLFLAAKQAEDTESPCDWDAFTRVEVAEEFENNFGYAEPEGAYVVVNFWTFDPALAFEADYAECTLPEPAAASLVFLASAFAVGLVFCGDGPLTDLFLRAAELNVFDLGLSNEG